MKKRAIITELLIWTVVIITMVGIAVFTYNKVFVKPNTYSIYFKDIDGITKGSPVRFMGINIGHVKKLSSIDKSVVVQILITKKNLKIPKGTTARVEFYGLGGSKSIELMPSNSPDAEGIVTTNNIRIADVVKEAKSFVQILEIIDKFVQSLDENAIQNMLETIKDTSPDKITDFENEIKQAGKEVTLKVEDIKLKQSEMAKTINKANDMVIKINKFVKN